MKSYEKRIVFFIDILGLKEKLNKIYSKKGNEVKARTKKLYNIYKFIHEYWIKSEVKEVGSSRKVTTFSDSIVLSFLYNEPSEIFYAIYDILHLQMELIHEEVLLRGAGVVGDLIHDDIIVFGKGLRDAYTLEDKVVQYPRIIIDEEILDNVGPSLFDNTPEQELLHVMSLLGKDSDGLHYINYISNVEGEFNDPHEDYIEYMQVLGNIIRAGLVIKKPEIKVKYLWMKEKYNLALAKYRNDEFLGLLDEDIKYGYLDLDEI